MLLWIWIVSTYELQPLHNLFVANSILVEVLHGLHLLFLVNLRGASFSQIIIKMTDR